MSNQRTSPAPAVPILVLWACGLSLALFGPPSFFANGVALGLAGASWLILARWAAEGRLPDRAVGFAIALGIGLRFLALSGSPQLSTDLDRYVFEGRVTLAKGPAFPFLVPPKDAREHGVDPRLLDASWRRINHPDIATLYPPLTQLVLASGALFGELWGGAHGAWIRLLFVLADLVAFALLARACVARNQPAAIAIAYLLAPLPLIETAREGHADALSACGLALGILGFLTQRPRRGYAGFAFAALAKLNGLVVLPAALRATRKGLLLAIALLAVLGAPLLFAGSAALTGLAEYGSRWRAGDGVFSILLELTTALLGGEWRRFGAHTVTTHLLARGLALGLWLSFAAAVLRRPLELDEVPAKAGLLMLALLLLAPTFHPWYAIWLLPFAVAAPRFVGRRAAYAAIGLAPLLQHPAFLELRTGTWADSPFLRGLFHLVVWAVLVMDLARARAFIYPRPQPSCPSETVSSSE